MIKNLNQLYTKYGTDKGDIGDHEDLFRNTGHSFGNFYQPFFEKYIGKKPDILEIGVYKGMSMLAHDEFFDSDCNIIGIDVYNGLEFDINKHKNMALILTGSESDETLSMLGDKKFDIIIDDAIHTYDNQFFNILHYSKMLKPGGIYILEDLQCNVEPRYISNPQFGLDNSPLLTLLNHKKSDLITDEEFDYLLNNITSMLLYSVPCEPDNYDSKMSQTSMTAVITFKNNG